jgi:hypothetical protein
MAIMKYKLLGVCHIELKEIVEWHVGYMEKFVCGVNVNWTLLWINMPKSQNCLYDFWYKSHVKFQQNLLIGV